MTAKPEDDQRQITVLSKQYHQQWHQLVSTTNWAKGKIICKWRESMRAAGFSAHHYSDESWSRRVGNVTPQHTGRLRKVYLRFDSNRKEYPKLHWSHFLIALDWDDAELWLEGAQQSQWSVSQMQKMRSTTLDKITERETPKDDIFVRDLSENVVLPATSMGKPEPPLGEFTALDASSAAKVDKKNLAGPHSINSTHSSLDNLAGERTSATEKLPQDLQKAFVRLERVISKHKDLGWTAVEIKTVIAQLDKLKIMVKSRM